MHVLVRFITFSAWLPLLLLGKPICIKEVSHA
jgi:hypothetical protein